jgi:putative phosphoribosyl transferase
MVHDIRKQVRTGGATEDEPVEIPAGSVLLQGDLSIPENALGLVIFAHGSGSSRHSPRNRAVARGLQKQRLATLLLDLLSPEEDEQSSSRFDLGLMTPRLEAALAWAGTQSRTKGLPIGLFGASTGAAVALEAAAELGGSVRAVVSRGGRPDLVGATLARVESPTLLIVGSRDEIVLGLNRRAYEQIGCKDKELAIIPGATHLFEEEGTLEKVTDHAAKWFLKQLPGKNV